MPDSVVHSIQALHKSGLDFPGADSSGVANGSLLYALTLKKPEPEQKNAVNPEIATVRNAGVNMVIGSSAVSPQLRSSLAKSSKVMYVIGETKIWSLSEELRHLTCK